MDLPSSTLPSEGDEARSQCDQDTASQSDQDTLSQSDKDALLRKRIMIGIGIAGAVVLLMGVRGPIAIARKSKEAQMADFAQLLSEEAEILARNQGVDPDHRQEESGEFSENSLAAESSAKKNQESQERKQVAGTKGTAETSKTSAKVDSKVTTPLHVCFEHECQIKAQRGYPSFNKVTLENLDGWFSRGEYLLAIRTITSLSEKLKKTKAKQGNLETLVTRVKADIAEYGKLKKDASRNKAKLDELRTQILQGWRSLPVIPPRMSLRASQTGVLGTLTARDEVMEIVDVNEDGFILVENTADMPYSQIKPERGPYWISGIDTSELVDGQRFTPQAVFQCVGEKSFVAADGTKRPLKKFEVVDFAALAKQAIEKSSFLK